MAGPKRQGEDGASRPDDSTGTAGRDGDLERRRRAFDAALTARRPDRSGGEDKPGREGMAGLGHALKLSSEFIAPIVVGAGLGWFIDRLAGTLPWGLIIFLLIGFGAGILNVLRSVGAVAEFGAVRRDDAEKRTDDK